MASHSGPLLFEVSLSLFLAMCAIDISPDSKRAYQGSDAHISGICAVVFQLGF